MATWVRVEGSGEVLASCETFRMNSQSATGYTYGIASVFTEPRLRGQGHAEGLISSLVDQLATTDPRAQACILFSEVGEALYRRSGFLPCPASDRLFLPLPGDPRERVEQTFTEGELAQALSAVRMEGEFRVIPSALQLDWHLERERIYAAKLKRDRPPICGARAGASTILWACDFKLDQLAVLLLDARRPSEAQALITSARRAAAGCGLGQVRVWEVPRPFTWNEGELRSRTNELPMIRFFDPTLRPESWRFIPRALWI